MQRQALRPPRTPRGRSPRPTAAHAGCCSSRRRSTLLDAGQSAVMAFRPAGQRVGQRSSAAKSSDLDLRPAQAARRVPVEPASPARRAARPSRHRRSARPKASACPYSRRTPARRFFEGCPLGASKEVRDARSPWPGPISRRLRARSSGVGIRRPAYRVPRTGLAGPSAGNEPLDRSLQRGPRRLAPARRLKPLNVTAARIDIVCRRRPWKWRRGKINQQLLTPAAAQRPRKSSIGSPAKAPPLEGFVFGRTPASQPLINRPVCDFNGSPEEAGREPAFARAACLRPAFQRHTGAPPSRLSRTADKLRLRTRAGEARHRPELAGAGRSQLEASSDVDGGSVVLQVARRTPSPAYRASPTRSERRRCPAPTCPHRCPPCPRQ